MRGRILLILVLVFFSLIFGVDAETSSFKSDFVVDGCTLGDNGLAIGACSKDGKYFCKESSEKGARPVLLNTLIDVEACSFGQSSLQTGQCCPSGYICDSGTLKCVQRKVNCGSLGETECKSKSCTWIDRGSDPGICVDRPTDYSCSVYTNQQACEEDVWNLGSSGIGTELCGTTFRADFDSLTKGYVVSPSSCNCIWDLDNSCKLSYKIADDIYSGVMDSVECRKSFSADSCVSGSQRVEWNASNHNPAGEFISKDITNVLAAGKCETGSGERTCGEPVFQLSGFSFFAFAFSVFLLVVYYSFFGFSVD